MSEFVSLRAADGHAFSAYVARPAGEPTAGLVVVQEIFGVNSHIRSVADGFAKDGFLAVAPALFDRIRPGIELGYEGCRHANRHEPLPQTRCGEADCSTLPRPSTLPLAQRAGKSASSATASAEPLAWLSATRLHPAAAIGYYGGRIGNHAAEKPACPVMLHFGRQDAHIPAEEVEKIHSAHPEVDIFWYDAGHAFNCDARASYNAAAAKEARQRSLAFLQKHLA